MHSELPAEEIVTGIFLAIGGALLLTPGFVTDAIGLMCLVPFTRKLFLSFLASSLFPVSSFSDKPNDTNKDWIEGEYKRDK